MSVIVKGKLSYFRCKTSRVQSSFPSCVINHVSLEWTSNLNVFLPGKMQKDFPSTPTPLTQGSCHAMDPSLPSPTQIPLTVVSNDPSAAPSQATKCPTFTEATTEYSSPQSVQTTFIPMGSPSPPLDKSKPSSPVPVSVSTKTSSPPTNKTSLNSSPNPPTPQISKTSTFSKLTSASSLACNPPAGSL